MAYSEALYTGDGTTTNFVVPFDYLDKSHVYAAVDKVPTSAVGSNYKAEFINSSTVLQFASTRWSLGTPYLLASRFAYFGKHNH